MIVRARGPDPPNGRAAALAAFSRLPALEGRPELKEEVKDHGPSRRRVELRPDRYQVSDPPEPGVLIAAFARRLRSVTRA